MSPATWPHAASTMARQLRVLQRAGLIDLRRPDRLAHTTRAMRTYGPIAGGILASARRAPERIALVDGAPLFHGTALSQFILSLNLGSTIVLHGKFDARRARSAGHRSGSRWRSTTATPG
ncbi:hypothetical protein [Nocardia sp. MW-W600-9]